MKHYRRHITTAYFSCIAAFALLLTACGQVVPPPPTPTASLPPATQTPLPTGTSSPSPIPSPTFTVTAAPTQTNTPTPLPTNTDTDTPTPEPTYVKLRGEVIVDQAVCHYGPGAPYLYKYGVYKGSNLEVIGRMERGDYILIQAIGGNNSCWVNPKWMNIKGDLQSVRPIPPEEEHLPMSPYYGPLTGVSARRDGNTVTVFWNGMQLRAGDDSLQVPYVVEAWVCQGGEFKFLPVGSYQPAAKIQDEPGCAETSHALVYAAEKHGYTRGVAVPWPAAEGQAQTSTTPTP